MIKLLDCTLRDGGYVNDWKFSREAFDAIIVGLQEVGIDVIEVGMLVKSNATEFITKFPDFSHIPALPRIKNSRSIFTVMFTYGEAKGIEVPPRKPDGIEALRLAYFKSDYRESLKLIEEFKQKGYEVFLQAMATFMYSDSELKEMLEQVNRLQPKYFSMVDSFGLMYEDDVRHMFNVVDSVLAPEIGIGFHAHNNQQLAFSNAVAFTELAENSARDVCIDASIYGMGRGAGNVNLELLTNYFNKRKSADYDTEKILELWRDYLYEDYKKYFWGYSWEHFLASINETNSAYIWYLKTKGVKDMDTIRSILNEIPPEHRYTLRREVVNPLIEKYKGKS